MVEGGLGCRAVTIAATGDAATYVSECLGSYTATKANLAVTNHED